MNVVKPGDVDLDANISTESLDRIALEGPLSRTWECILSPFRSWMPASQDPNDETPDENSVAERSESPRLEWSKKTDFLLSIIGFAVDLANVSNNSSLT